MSDNFLIKIKDELGERHASRYTPFSGIEGIIIRGHILLEQELDTAIGLNIPKKEHYDSEKFTFSHKVRIARMLGLIDSRLTEVNNLNKLRNQIAHTLSHDDKLVDSIIREIEKENDDAKPGGAREERLKESISFLCGHLAGFGSTLGAYSKLRKHPEDVKTLLGKLDEALTDDEQPS